MVKNLLATALAWGMYDIAYTASINSRQEMTTAIFGVRATGRRRRRRRRRRVEINQSINQRANRQHHNLAVGIPAVLHALWCLDRIGSPFSSGLRSSLSRPPAAALPWRGGRCPERHVGQ